MSSVPWAGQCPLGKCESQGTVQLPVQSHTSNGAYINTYGAGEMAHLTKLCKRENQIPTAHAEKLGMMVSVPQGDRSIWIPGARWTAGLVAGLLTPRPVRDAVDSI